MHVSKKMYNIDEYIFRLKNTDEYYIPKGCDAHNNSPYISYCSECRNHFCSNCPLHHHTATLLKKYDLSKMQLIK